MFKILKNIGATSPTPLSSRAIRDSRSREGSRRVGDVGAESRGIKNYASSGESTLTDEDYREMMRIVRDLPDGTDVCDIIGSYVVGLEDDD